MALSQYGLKDDLLVQTLCEQLAEGICGTEDVPNRTNHLLGHEFGIYIYHGIYDIPKKGSDQSEQWESEEVYSFLVCVVAPVDKDYNAGNPKCGFIFPAFEDRSSEPGKIDIFFENPDRPDDGFLRKILGKGWKIIEDVMLLICKQKSDWLILKKKLVGFQLHQTKFNLVILTIND